MFMFLAIILVGVGSFFSFAGGASASEENHEKGLAGAFLFIGFFVSLLAILVSNIG